jgi:hypothetical protein
MDLSTYLAFGTEWVRQLSCREVLRPYESEINFADDVSLEQCVPDQAGSNCPRHGRSKRLLAIADKHLSWQ